MLTSQVEQSTAKTTPPAQNPSADLGRKEIFLKLLVAQMQYQDPLNPQDPTQMSSQLAQFNMLEQQLRTNRLLERYLKQATGGGQGTGALWLAAASLLGRSAVVASDRVHFDGTNPVSFQVLAKDAVTLRIEVRASDGSIVRHWTAQPANGQWTLAWDGRTDSGAVAPAGVYRIVALAKDATGTEVRAEVRWKGVITAARQENGTLGFRVAGVDLPADAIREILQ